MENEVVDKNNIIRSVSIIVSAVVLSGAVLYGAPPASSPSKARAYDSHGHEITNQSPASTGSGCGV